MDPSRDPGPHPRPSLIEALGRALRPPRALRPTRAGWVFFALTLGVGFAALNTGNNLLYLVLALMLAFLVLSGVLSESALRDVKVRRRLPGECFAGCANPVVLEIRNDRRRFAAFAVVVEDLRTPTGRERVGPPLGRVFTLRIDPGETLSKSYPLEPEHRGELGFWGFRLSTRFPFGLFSKSLVRQAPDTLLVYPEISEIDPMALRGELLQGTEGSVAFHGAGIDAAGLRAFAPGDGARRVHWRASLRRGALLVRNPEDLRQSEIEVRLRTRGTQPGANFEQRVREAASLAVAYLRTGVLVGLRTDSAQLPPASGSRQHARILSCLARVAPEPDQNREAA